ncbi:MAG TPA: hypothetical protein VJ909_00140 [Prolixibacteraceae bacterium]|nr:hypothetical protein [Prolixibacteraceae bacterium]
MRPTKQAQKYFANNFSCSQLNNPDDLKHIQKEKMIEKRCPKYIDTAVQLVEQMFEAE